VDLERRMFAAKLSAAVLAVGLMCGVAAAQTSGKADAIVNEMRQGGLILVYRHTATRQDQPAAGEALSRDGENQAAAAGRMLRDLGVPTGDTYTGTAKRAFDTARLARFRNVMMLNALTDSDAPATRIEKEDRVEAFRVLLRERPQRGANVMMVADKGSIAAAIGADLANMQEGELVVVRPDVRIEQGFDVVGRLTLHEVRDYWSQGRGDDALKRVRW
jgi:hypothetical protein